MVPHTEQNLLETLRWACPESDIMTASGVRVKFNSDEMIDFPLYGLHAGGEWLCWFLPNPPDGSTRCIRKYLFAAFEWAVKGP